jgi:hypothetical protein
MRTIEVVDADKNHARYDLNLGDVFGFNGKFYVVAKFRSETIGVCLNDSSMLEYDEFPLYSQLYHVTEVAKL